MNLHFNLSLADNYKNESQKIRVLTESWVADNMFCPHCGTLKLNHFENNKPVADFYCPVCGNQYELKSKDGGFGKKINDGAYDTMIQRISSNDNPDFFILNYEKNEGVVNDFVFIPKHFFIPQIIEKRKPLSPAARRAGWTGCNILLNEIPEQGRIPIIKNRVVLPQKSVIEKVQKGNLLITNDINARGWLFDILIYVNKIDTIEFTLDDIYQFELELSAKHPQNNNIRPKIRQQLQELRDRKVIEFLGQGRYRKII